MNIDQTIEDRRWHSLSLPDLAERAAFTTLTHLGLDTERCEVSLLACNDARITTLNRDFRDKDTATNVLSWPAFDLAPPIPGATPLRPAPDHSGEIALGDLAISWETCAREAHSAGLPMADHVTHLVVHGLLHLLGYDHIRDPDATLMQTIEAEILGKLGVADPY